MYSVNRFLIMSVIFTYMVAEDALLPFKMSLNFPLFYVTMHVFVTVDGH